MALGDAILACLTERPMTGYELAKTFDSSIGFFWKTDHQQIYRELSRLRDRGYIQGRWVEKEGDRRKRYYRLTPAGRKVLLDRRSRWAEFVVFAVLTLVLVFRPAGILGQQIGERA